MKISIENFKSIEKLPEFELMPLTVLSGINSAGKSSFIQLLLLVKQTIEANAADQQLSLNGEYFKVRDYEDILQGRVLENKLKVTFGLTKQHFAHIENPKNLAMYNALGDYTCDVEIEFDKNDTGPFISLFAVRFEFADKTNDPKYFEVYYDGKEQASINTDSPVFNIKLVERPIVSTIGYTSIYPLFYEAKATTSGDTSGLSSGSKEVIELDDFKDVIDSFFRNISYIGPVRARPKDTYPVSSSPKNVGSEGQYVAQILKDQADEPISFKGVEFHEGGLNYVDMNLPLGKAVKYWMCDVFKVAADIYAEKGDDFYRILLKRNSGLVTSIKHVGFGISQLLPIVVEGLIMSKNGTLILEQPEEHLHPKVQSYLFDFLYGLTLEDKTILVETHSSHFITRMRRRIAEDPQNLMDKRINLTFIENDRFKIIELNDLGTLTYYPDEFIEPSNEELGAIVQAQMNKRAKRERE